MTDVIGRVVDDQDAPLAGARVRAYETRLLLTRSLRAFADPSTSASVVGMVGPANVPVLEIKVGPANNADFARVATDGLAEDDGWICTRWRDSHYALLFDQRIEGSVATTDVAGEFSIGVPADAPTAQMYRVRAALDDYFDGDSERGIAALPFGLALTPVEGPIIERRLVGLLHHFRGWYYAPKRPGVNSRYTPQYPYDIGITLKPDVGRPSPATYDDCCSFVESILVRAWKDSAIAAFTWDRARHDRAMITDTANVFSSVEVLQDNAMADSVDDTDVPPPWTVVQGWRDKSKLSLGGHTFIVVDVHKETGRVLTLESNLTYNLNGPGMRMLGNVDRFMRAAYLCPTDGYVYDPVAGDPAHGVPRGTPFRVGTLWELARGASVPSDWVCPGCGTAKVMFTPYCRPPEHWWENPYLQTWKQITSYYQDRRLARLRVRDLTWVR